MFGRTFNVHTSASVDVSELAVCGFTKPSVGSLYTSRSNTADAGGPSLVPELGRMMGSSPAISAPLRNVMVPPGWISAEGAVVGALVTFEMPPVTGLLAWRAVVLVV